MFVCEQCISDYIIEGGSMRLKNSFRSMGTCEDCHQTKLCFDIPLGMYAHKESKFGKAMIKQGLQTIQEIRGERI